MRRFLSAAYGTALRTIYGRRGLPWRIHDEIVRIDPGVRHLVPHAPEPALFEFLRRTIRPGDVVLDVGAFLGIYALLAARWTGPAGRVVALEPTPSSVARARRHLAWNQPEGGHVTLVEAAVSDAPGRATLHQYDAQEMPYVNSLAAAADTTAAPRLREVPVVTIDDVCRDLQIQPSIIRMDVQGAEVHALRGARRTVAGASRLAMVVEMHPQCWPGFGVGDAEARETIASLGLEARPLVDSEPLLGRDTHAVLTKRGPGAIA